MDKITIQGLQIHSLIGVYAWEREAMQPLTLDVELTMDLTKAGKSDDVNDTVDYALLAKELGDLAQASDFKLLEALGDAMLTQLMASYPLQAAKVRIAKPEILPNARYVAVEMQREA